MMNIGTPIRFPEGLQSARTVGNDAGGAEKSYAQLLELRTATGTVYVCPSRWERIRLLWAFRYFHVLPLQLLHRRDQRLIERLLQSALVTPDLPVAKKAIFGVVEKVRSKPAESADRSATGGTELATPQAGAAKPGRAVFPGQDLSRPETRFVERLRFGSPKVAGNSEIGSVQDGVQDRLQDRILVRHRAAGDTAGGRAALWLYLPRLWAARQRWAWGVLGAVCFVVILAQVCRTALFPSHSQTPSARFEQPATSIKPQDLHTPAPVPLRASLPTPPLPGVGKPKHKVVPQLPAPALPAQESLQSDGLGQLMKASSPAAVVFNPAADSAAIAPSGMSGRPFVAELPQDYFAHPVVSNPKLVGVVQLRALIAADGSVKAVTVLRGNEKLAAAGIRAVLQWHYKPYQALGHPVEVETQINMSFFGQDANSITSVANNPASELK